MCHCEDNSYRTFHINNPNPHICMIYDFISIHMVIIQMRNNRTSTPNPQPSPVLDYVWYPTASPYDPASFCFVASIRECPVKLLDVTDERLCASHKILDDRERQVAPHGLAFNLATQKYVLGCFSPDI
ncbi:hypothetical protein BJ165DRAFT_1435699 [Panaeolus papilionaceus]|nr:hypothetical protein BJ165DRAFT_1435699 [Panaeolus papilionaceus]